MIIVVDFKTAISSLRHSEAASIDGWPALESIIQSDPLLSGEADHVSSDLLEEALAFVEMAQSVQDVEGLGRKHQSVILSSLWSKEYHLHQNLFVMGFVKNVLSTSRTSRRSIRLLGQSALEYWNTSAKGFVEILTVISKLAQHQKGWLGTASKMGAFDLDGPERFAASLIDASEPLDVFNQWGIRPSLRQSEFTGAAFRELCSFVQDNPTLNNIGKLWTLAKFGVEAEKQIAFETHRASLARACLSPWHNRPAPPDVKEFLLEQFRSAYGDPRMNRSHWLQVDPQDEKLIKRWLAGESLELFLDIVGKDAEAHMWDYRRAFWEACFKKNIIDEAWVAFGTSGWQRLKLYKQRDGLRTVTAGKLSGAETTQSVLLMRMGDLTLVEWSHNGQIWFLDTSLGTHLAPQLYLSTYQAEKCRGFGRVSIFNRSHNGAEGWSWQRQTAEKIRQYTGVRINQSESMPKRY